MFDQRNYENNGLFYLRWVARILSLATISLLFLFVIGEGIDLKVIEYREWLGLLFFPFGLFAGLLISWRNEGFGGIISVGSLAAFYLIYGLFLNGKLWLGWTFILFGFPGFLFLLYWLFLPKNNGLRHI